MQQIIMCDYIVIVNLEWLKCLFFELPTAKITLGLVALWISSWTPYATVALLGISGYQHRLTPSKLLIQISTSFVFN